MSTAGCAHPASVTLSLRSLKAGLKNRQQVPETAEQAGASAAAALDDEFLLRLRGSLRGGREAARGRGRGGAWWAGPGRAGCNPRQLVPSTPAGGQYSPSHQIPEGDAAEHPPSLRATVNASSLRIPWTATRQSFGSSMGGHRGAGPGNEGAGLSLLWGRPFYDVIGLRK